MDGPEANCVPPIPARFRIRRLADTGSTNADALAAAAAGEPEGLVVVADHQRAGRGRSGRRWEAPAGANLLVSVLFRPGGPERWHRPAAAVAVAACDAVAALGVPAALKWPNDLLAGDDKLAGVLAESDGAGAVVVGLGLNVGWPPDGARAGATSLRALGVEVERDEVLARVLAGVDEDAPDLAERYAARCATLGRRVRLELPGGAVVEGVADGLEPDGRLVVATGGRRRAFSAADVTHLRPVPDGPRRPGRRPPLR